MSINTEFVVIQSVSTFFTLYISSWYYENAANHTDSGIIIKLLEGGITTEK